MKNINTFHIPSDHFYLFNKIITKRILNPNNIISRLLILCLFFFNTSIFAQPCETNGYPYNIADITWTDTGGPAGFECPPYSPGHATYNGIADIVAAFNNARTIENGQTLAAGQVTMPMMTLAQLGGSDLVWNAKTPSQKAFILMNLERTARGIPPFQEVDANVQAVAQKYAEYLLDNDAFDHNLGCDGADPCNTLVRMDQNEVINGHREFTCRFENLAAFYSPSEQCAPLTAERSVYMWIYDDLSSNNGHRNACLFNAFSDNYSTAGAEGQFGLGLAAGPYNGWDYGVVVVFNFFDPNESYNPSAPLELTTFLEGAYNNVDMDNTLSAVIPLTSPYAEDPQNVTSIPANTVDWVLVQIRDKNNSSTILFSKSAFVLKNGSVVEKDGISPLNFPVVADNYFVSVKHRNHLSVMSNAALSLNP